MIAKQQIKTVITPLLLIFCVLSCWECRKDDLNTDSNFRLAFSNDTVLFDTVFTTIGTATQKLMVYNHGKERVVISRIKLARGNASPFRINVDGRSAFEVTNWELAKKDSMFIFVKATIDPNQEDAPLIQTDSIIFEINGAVQTVKLVAWGQDAYFYKNVHFSRDTTLKNNKPHVVYGWLVADPNVKLNIEAGTKLYFHYNSGLYIDNGAQITVNGTPESPVEFSQDSRVKANDTVPGQWQGIELSKESGPHTFSNVLIKNAMTGLLVDPGSTPVKLYNCEIKNHLRQGIYAKNATIEAGNCLVSNCGAGLFVVESGGSYDFRQCTFANYRSFYPGRSVASISLANFSVENRDTIPSDLQNAYFGNCILDGTFFNELGLKNSSKAAFHFQFENSVAKTEPNETYLPYFVNCITNPIKDSIFADAKKYNFALNKKSPAIDLGSLQIVNTSAFNLQVDAKGNSRTSDFAPDAGALEYLGGKK